MVGGNSVTLWAKPDALFLPLAQTDQYNYKDFQGKSGVCALPKVGGWFFCLRAKHHLESTPLLMEHPRGVSENDSIQ